MNHQAKMLSAIAGAILIAGALQVPRNDAAALVSVIGALMLTPGLLTMLWRCFLKPCLDFLKKHGVNHPPEQKLPVETDVAR